jgi:hypothetical protein
MSTERVYHIRVRGVLDSTWSDWFGGLVVIPQANGETLLTGPVTDQAALYGLLNKIRDIGLPLVSVEPTTTGEQSDPQQGGEPHG